MEFTDINDAYAVRVNPVGANPVGDMSGGIPAPPALQSNPEPVVFLPPLNDSHASTTPVYPDTVITHSAAQQSQPASAAHRPYAGPQAPFVDAAQLAPPPADEEPGYFERLGMRRKDLLKLVVLAVMVTLGISIHWVGAHYVTEWIESSDFDPKQRLAIRLAYPAAVAFALWNLKAYQ